MISVLERIYASYESKATVQDPIIREQFAVLESCMQDEAFELSNCVSTAAIAIGAESEKLAYMDGLVDGARLMLEIMEKKPHR